jgi:hypothetical protein
LKALRTVRDFVFNSATATIGVKLAQDEVGPAFPTHTFAGSYLKAILLGTILAFLLGLFVYWKWRVRTAFWVAIIGPCTFAWRLSLGTPNPKSPAEIVNAATYVLLSVQCVSYSLGAFSCFWWTNIAEKHQAVTP